MTTYYRRTETGPGENLKAGLVAGAAATTVAILNGARSRNNSPGIPRVPWNRSVTCGRASKEEPECPVP